jgi:PTH1 family peptidyl-tRNA hydrolase
VGLGNPGERYRGTRHNVGFRVVEELARRHGARLDTLECNALVGAFVRAPAASPLPSPEMGEAPVEVLLAQPLTYMNRSGYATRCLVERHGFTPSDLLVVFDEVHLPLGRLRLRRSGSPGGHRGMESILESLQSAEVPRLRLGVAGETTPEGGDELVDFVLAPFAPQELGAVDEMILRAADACDAWIADGVEATMNAFNR